MKRLLIDAAYPDEVRVVILKNNKLLEFDYESREKENRKGNIYLGKVTRVEPSLQAAFIDFGCDRHGFLPFTEIHPSYFHIPQEDKSADREDSEEDVVEEISIQNDQLQEIRAPELAEDDDELAPAINVAENEIEGEADSRAVEDGKSEEANEDFDEDRGRAKAQDDVHRKYKIQEVIKRGQIVLVQVMKEERGNKGASLTTYMSIAGRYAVLMPNSENRGGVSRRISDSAERNRLRKIIDKFNVHPGSSIILRTAGSGKLGSEIKRDFEYLIRLWNNIRDKTLKAKAPAFIHAEGDLIKRTIRDLYDDSINEVLVQGEKAYTNASDFMRLISPGYESKIKLFDKPTPIFCEFGIEEQLASLHNPVAPLESGGYVVINPTEALIAIDVNSGRSTSERNVEETALKTNIEAAQEIARQIRLRDLAGLIVIDFIDMYELKNRKQVERALRDALYKDRARIQIGIISPFGLLEMSRQRLRSSFAETYTVPCVNCSGRGVTRSPETTAVMILRTIESEIYQGHYESIDIFAHPQIALYILNNKRKDLDTIEVKYNIRIFIHQDLNNVPDSFSIEKLRRRNVSPKQKNRQNALSSLESEEIYQGLDQIKFEEEEEAAPGNSINDIDKNPKKKKKNRNRNRNKARKTTEVDNKATQQKENIGNEKDSVIEDIGIDGNNVADENHPGFIKGFLKKILE